ncbi:MAG: cupin domain-containing protein [bacterium]|nr:cupin domain-containing protein [bacterium]
MIIRKLDDVKKTKMEMEGAKDVARQLVFGSADGVPNFSIRVFTLEVGGYSPHHTHEVEHLNYILSGQGALLDSEGNANSLNPGEFAFVAPGDVHQFRNTSETEPFVFICAVPKAYE